MIQFKKLIPRPLAGTDLSDSGLWASEEQEILQGESVLIYSPSGKGKTSFLSFVYGMRKDFYGSITIFNKDIASYSENEWETIRRTQISSVFQGLRLFPTLNALENIQLKNKLTSHRTEQEILVMAERLELTPFLKQKVSTLSFGQQQRVAIIRALCQPFYLLLLDEPFSHIDTALQKKAWALIEEERKKQNASLVITLLQPLDMLQTDKTFTI